MKKYILLLMLFSGTALAAAGDQATIATVARNISVAIIDSLGLVFNIAYLLGAVVFMSGLYFFHLNGSRPNQGFIKTAIVSLIVGSALLSLPTIIQTTLETMFVSDSKNSIVDDSNFKLDLNP
jgi:hypothetical protein